MEYVNFGKAGVRVSRLAFGLGLRGQNDPAEAQRAIEHAIDQGINFIDCANIYGFMDDRANVRTSEAVLGKAIKGKRDDVLISSKVASEDRSRAERRGTVAISHHARGGNGRCGRSIRTISTSISCTGSTIRFRWRRASGPWMISFIRARSATSAAATTRHGRCASRSGWRIGLNAIPYMCVQNMYSLLNRHLEKEMFPFLRDAGLGAMAYSPLHIGLLSGLYYAGRTTAAGILVGHCAPQRQFAAMAGEAAQRVMADRHQIRGRTRQDARAVGHRMGAVAPGNHASHHGQRYG